MGLPEARQPHRQLPLFDLTGKKALVTGGGVGIGRACATALALSGVDVAISGRTREPAERTCEELRKLGVDAFFVKGDVAKEGEVDEMTAEVVRRFGRLDIGVNNAGGALPGSALDTSLEDWNQVIGSNLTGVFLCARAQARQMIRQRPAGGKIINISSMYATTAGGTASYNASKAAVVHLTRTLAVEWGSQNINVNCISPGWMLTPANRGITPELRVRMREVTPMGSLLRHEDIHGALIYLASAASNFVTGHDLVVDGGHTLNTWLRPLQRSVPPRTSPEDEEREFKVDLENRGL